MRRRKTTEADEAPRRVRGSPSRSESLKIPHDAVNEIVMLAAVMVDQEAASKYLPSIAPESFYGAGHAVAWATLQKLHAQGLSYDPATVQQMSGGLVDAELLNRYIKDRPRVPPNIRHHAECIAWDRARVEAVRGPVSAFLEAVRDPTSDPAKVRALARAIGTSFEGYGDRRYLRDSSQIVRAHRQSLIDRRLGRAVFPYGLPNFDFYGENDKQAGEPRMIPGAAPGQLTVVVGISGCGKSTTTARIALEQARQGRKVLYGAWEQGSAMTLEVIAAISLGWSRTDLMVGRYTEEDQEELLTEMERLGEWIRFLELPYGREIGSKRTNGSNLDLMHQYVADVSPDVFVADLFKRAMADIDPEAEEMALWRIQAIAQETQAHGILVHQLRLKDVEQRPDQRPTRESIKGNSAWIDVADTIIGWYRPSLAKNVPDDTIQGIILKQRYGEWPLAVEFDWNPQFGSIENGRAIEYDRPGSSGESMDGLLGESFLRNKPSGTGRKRR